MNILSLRMAHQRDCDRIEAFYSSNPDPNVAKRDVSDIIESIDDGRFFVIQSLTERTDTKPIVAASAIFDPEQGPYWQAAEEILGRHSEHDRPHRELGGSLVLPAYRGLGLHKILLAVRLGFLKVNGEIDAGAIVYSTVTQANEVSAKNQMKAGMEAWDCHYAAFLKPCAACAEPRYGNTNCCKVFFKFDTANLDKHTKLLLQGDIQREKRDASKRPTGESFRIVLDLPFLDDPDRDRLLATRG
ncbi:MAG: hypothetical protein NXI21_10395 [Alphaproteobacteria bacterium]|nr:hypothetical protein [Alphaproteobacteria bacterium]